MKLTEVLDRLNGRRCCLRIQQMLLGEFEPEFIDTKLVNHQEFGVVVELVVKFPFWQDRVYLRGYEDEFATKYTAWEVKTEDISQIGEEHATAEELITKTLLVLADETSDSNHTKTFLWLCSKAYQVPRGICISKPELLRKMMQGKKPVWLDSNPSNTDTYILLHGSTSDRALYVEK